ncbi:hypothetical protein [Streptosporangium oxazolinicum]
MGESELIVMNGIVEAGGLRLTHAWMRGMPAGGRVLLMRAAR